MREAEVYLVLSCQHFCAFCQSSLPESSPSQECFDRHLYFGGDNCSALKMTCSNHLSAPVPMFCVHIRLFSHITQEQGHSNDAVCWGEAFCYFVKRWNVWFFTRILSSFRWKSYIKGGTQALERRFEYNRLLLTIKQQTSNHGCEFLFRKCKNLIFSMHSHTVAIANPVAVEYFMWSRSHNLPVFGEMTLNEKDNLNL